MKCNIAGMAWKSKNKEIIRQYDFNYDRLNRLLGASFTQHDPDACTYSITPNFSVSGLSYDANGNILTMNQMGLIPGHSILIDSLHYQYQTQDGYNYTNKLRSVTDASFNSQNLSDFKDNESNGQNDYRYNLNGSLMRDNNKYIASIEYNHLNLPVRIEIANHPGVTNGVILYKYDALGNKQVKTVKETVNNIPCSATTYYLGEMVYEKREGYPGADGEVKLQFISNEEGRAIYDSANPAFHYQYMMRDHLGNIRMLLNAEEQPQQSYPNCDFEQEHATENETYYLNTNTYLITPPPAFNNGQGTGAQCQLIKNNEAPIGVGKLLKVMATDEVGVKLDYYIPTTTVDNTGANPVQNLIGSIIAILNNPSYTGSLHGSGITVGASFEHDVPLNNLLQQQGPTNPSNNVKAYLNILFFDACALWRKQFNFICQQSQYQQLSIMGSPQTITILGSSMIKAPANGYVYIYVSNESRNPVYIDNFQVVHRPGRIVEETHYYPFGLIQQGISSKAAGMLENKQKFMGKEQQSKEFSDGSGLEWNDFGARMFDPQIGRWNTVDPLANKFSHISPYVAFNNSPLRFTDPTGMEPKDWILSVGSKVYWYGGNAGDKTNLIATFNATSGNAPHKDGDADKNYQFGKYQKVRDMGPTAEGQYLINLKPSFDRVAKAGSDGELVRNKQGGVEKIPDEVPVPGDKENVWTYEDWGTNRAYLSPIKVTGATSKDRDITSFYLHDSEKGYTHGCTEVQTELFDKLAEYKKAGNEKIDVIVQYPDKNALTNGGTKKTP